MQHFDDDLYLNGRRLLAVGDIVPVNEAAAEQIRRSLGIEAELKKAKPVTLAAYDFADFPLADAWPHSLIFSLTHGKVAVSNGVKWVDTLGHDLTEEAPVTRAEPESHKPHADKPAVKIQPKR